MKLTIKPHTIVLMVGPSGCGKTTFAKEVIAKQLKDKVKVSYISSDDLRAELLGLESHEIVNKESVQMLEVSSKAFDLLHAKLEAYTSYPVNSEVVIVDTKGLSEEFRKEIVNVAKKNNYNVDVVVFNFKKMSDYYSDVNVGKRLIENNVKRLRQNVLRELSLKKYNNIHTVTRKDFIENPSNYTVEIENYEWYKSHILPAEYDYLIVGDIHECLEEFVELLRKSKFEIENGKIVGNGYSDNKRIVLVGDYVDKGKNTEEIVEFMYENKDWIYFVTGNHEDFVNRVLNGKVEEEKITAKKLYYFDSILKFREDEELTRKFKELVELSRAFYVSKGERNSTFYVTHAPCENKYVGKVDKKSIKNQTNIPIDYDLEGTESYVKNLENQLGFLSKEKGMNEPFHIFGHVSTLNDYRVGNKLGIDTGCVFGNRLTGVGIGSGKVFYHSVKSGKESVLELPDVFKRARKTVNLSMLEKQEIRKLNYAANNKINFISGTMSPSDKDIEKNELESLDKGLDYFKNSGVTEVILQPKFMGSRCNVYLFKDKDKSYAVSRNGYIIKKLDTVAMEEFIEKNSGGYADPEEFEKVLNKEFGNCKNLDEMFNGLHDKHVNYMEENNLNMIILDGELLPWSVLGEGLIETSFKPLESMASLELGMLEQYGFMENYSKVKESLNESEFSVDKNNMNKKDLISKYGNRDYDTFKSLVGDNHESISTLQDMLSVYKEQMDIFGNAEEVPYFEGFNILKMVDNEGNRVFFKGNNEDIFSFVSDNDYVVVDLSTEEGYEKAKEFYELLTLERKMEGVVIKPLVDKDGVLPFMKVRNPDYLMLVYGYDYKLEDKYSKLINQKSINRKVNTSLKEHAIGKDMLAISSEDINKDNKDFMQLVANMLLEVREEGNIDPRL